MIVCDWCRGGDVGLVNWFACKICPIEMWVECKLLWLVYDVCGFSCAAGSEAVFKQQSFVKRQRKRQPLWGSRSCAAMLVWRHASVKTCDSTCATQPSNETANAPHATLSKSLPTLLLSPFHRFHSCHVPSCFLWAHGSSRTFKLLRCLLTLSPFPFGLFLAIPQTLASLLSLLPKFFHSVKLLCGSLYF